MKTEETPTFNDPVEAEFLPMHNIKSIVRMILPEKNAAGKKVKVTRQFYHLLSRMVAEFFHVIASQIYLTIRSKSIVNEEDILAAIESLGMTQYVLPLRVFMNDYRVLTYKVITKRLGLQTGQGGLLALTEEPE
jgi:histone H3/H4